MQKTLLLIIFLCLLSVASFLLALSVGSIHFSMQEIYNSLLNNGAHTDNTNIAQTIIFDLRLPRALVAYISGGMLALAGLLMQILLRNPLADPYILGVSGGASVAALLAMSIGLGSVLVSTAAFSGALISILLVFVLAQGRGSWNANRLLLTGVVLAAGWAAAINFILTAAPDEPLRGMLFWLMGDINHSNMNIYYLYLLLIATFISFILAPSLNILSRGDLQASALGVEIKPLRSGLFLLASALTAFAVVQAGSIGFIGLIVPHMLRLMIGSDHRILVPACVLLGGSLLLISDTLARSILAPQQLPVGVITAALGVPFFLYLLNLGFKREQ